MKKIIMLLALIVVIFSDLLAQPVKKVLFEEITGGWAGYCPRSFALRDSLMAVYPGQIIPVTLHNGDAMENNQANAIHNQFGASAYPTALIDRKQFPGQTGIAVNTNAYLSSINTQLNITPKLSINISSTFNTNTRQSDVTVSMNFNASATGNLRVHLFYVEDSVIGIGNPYNQANYYGQGCAAANPSNPYYSYPCVIPNFGHRFVFRYSASPLLGTTGVIPNSVSAGDSFGTAYSYIVPASFNSDKMSLVAFVTNSGNAVLNAESVPMDACAGLNCTLGATTTITNITGTGCNNGKIKVNLSGGVNLFPHLELYGSGGNLLKSVNLASSATSYTFNNLASGTYTVKVFDGNCCETVLANKQVKCPVPSSGFFTNNVTSTGAKVHWNTVNCNAGYKVAYRKQGVTAWTTTTTPVNNKSLTGLTPGSSYEWKVATKCINSVPAVYSAYSTIHTFNLPLRLSSNGTGNDNEISGLNLFPNPVQNQLNISFNGTSEKAVIKIINIAGQVMMQKEVTTNGDVFETIMDTGMLPAGIYSLVVQSGNSISEKRFIRE